ncbi:unnamed protein product [Eruca vesicaria subsp. sativa]|uniref:Uncharacterized protein n=1 Tax=Eruca vesicaria subsp. sativa TaxID=29727 RepID=A0ABC8LK07_ERUVS|nr:unnamed protein product [Eruca vesicaria subsp. sativa]
MQDSMKVITHKTQCCYLLPVKMSDGCDHKIWDCGSPLYDSYELVSFAHIIERKLLPFSPFTRQPSWRLRVLMDKDKDKCSSESYVSKTTTSCIHRRKSWWNRKKNEETKEYIKKKKRKMSSCISWWR